MACNSTIHQDLLRAQNLLYQPYNLMCGVIVQDIESKEYGACTFELSHKIIKFRVAKITPTKVGQFVTLWKRIGNGPIIPYDMADSVDLFVVSVCNAEYFGQFVFPKDVLWHKGFVSKNGKGGKRAMRVYPPWDIAPSHQAQKTQEWQLKYFLAIQPIMDVDNIKRLF